MTIYNFFSWMAQMGLLVAIAALAGLALHASPRARLIFWQGVLALALLLPVVQPWSKPHESADSVSVATGAIMTTGRAPAGFHLEWHAEYLLWIAAAGALARIAWIGIGLARLRRHRLAARRFSQPPVPFENAHVAWYLSETISGPVTFGWRRANILLPARFAAMPAEIQEAIACHELMHVERSDWLFVIAEELVRAMFWFHPAVWFALANIQLAREQVVDGEVIRLTRDRERYLEALVAVAEQKFQPDLAPAPLFLTKRHLASRVAAILKERRMSKARIAASFATVASAALVAARVAVFLFPLHSSAQPANTMSADSPGITVDAGAPLLHRAPVVRPDSVTSAGTVVIDATLNSKGEVSDARVISGPDELRRPALESVLQWHYSNDPLPPSPLRLTIQFGPAPARAEVQNVQTTTQAPLVPPESPSILKSIEIAGAPPELAQKLRDALPFHEGDQLPPGARAQMIAAAKNIDEHFTGRVFVSGEHEAFVRFTLGTPSPSDTAVPPQRIRVGSNVQQANLLVAIPPVYPPLAKQARVQGIVHLSLTIGKDGTVQNVEVLSGHPLLIQAAVEAVKQWQYKPTLLNGSPVEVLTTADVSFTLAP